MTENKLQQYYPTSRMRDLLADNPLLLPALTRFGISLGFGDRTVSDICRDSGIDTSTFLAVASYVGGKPYTDVMLDARTLVLYLKNAHAYFLDYLLPGIRRKLIDAISTGAAGDIALVIMKFYDSYVDEVRRHMNYEDELVFTYVDRLLDGRADGAFRISDFRDNHRPIAEKLKEIKEILICHFTADKARVDLLNSLLFEIVLCERDLINHCLVEDNLFVPTIERLERHVADVSRCAVADTVADTQQLDANGDILLTPRERDIVVCIAHGLSNKEIADKLFLSVHTVATHRRNICAKLDIHSAAGMTVFAILHGLVSVDDFD